MIRANNLNKDCNKCIFKNACVFNVLEPGAQTKWNKTKRTFHYKNENIIYKEGDQPKSIFIVCKGRVKMYTTDSNGQQMISWIRHPGKIFGLVSFFTTEKDYFCTGKCMGDTIVSEIDKKTFDKFLKAYPKLYKIFINKLCDDMRAMHGKLKDTAYKTAKMKIANILLQSISFKSKDTTNPEVYGIKRTEIAEITGLALETVVRALSNMEKNRIISRETNYIKIINLEKLNKLASSDA